MMKQRPSRPCPAIRMLEGCGMILTNPKDASQAYGSLWRTKDAAKAAFQRSGMRPTLGFSETTRLQRLLVQANDGSSFVMHLCRVDYQRAGRGQQAAVAWYDPYLCSKPGAFLRKRLGPLVKCEIEPPGPDYAATQARPVPSKPAPRAPQVRVPVPEQLALSLPEHGEVPVSQIPDRWFAAMASPSCAVH